MGLCREGDRSGERDNAPASSAAPRAPSWHLPPGFHRRGNVVLLEVIACLSKSNRSLPGARCCGHSRAAGHVPGWCHPAVVPTAQPVPPVPQGDVSLLSIARFCLVSRHWAQGCSFLAQREKPSELELFLLEFKRKLESRRSSVSRASAARRHRASAAKLQNPHVGP